MQIRKKDFNRRVVFNNEVYVFLDGNGISLTLFFDNYMINTYIRIDIDR